MIITTVVLAVILLVGASLSAWALNSRDKKPFKGALFEVKKGPLTISVTAKGDIKNREMVVVKCRAEGRNRIISLVDEGVFVKKGDLLMELDSSQFVERKDRQEIVVTNAKANFIRARENLVVTESQGKSDIAKAKLDLQFARQDLEKYLEGEYPQQLKQANTDITIADEESKRAKARLEASEKLADKGYITLTELKADSLSRMRSKLNYEMAISKLGVLTKYTHVRMLAKLKSDVSQTAMALDRTKRRAASDILRGEVVKSAKESEHNRQQSQLDRLSQQIINCTILSPVDAQVVYSTTVKQRRWGSNEPLAQGQEVSERKELFHLPTAKAMMAEIKIHENSLKKVKLGMPVVVVVGAFPNKTFNGRLMRISPMPDAQSRRLNPDMNMFVADVHIEGENGDLRTGLSCTAEILVAEYSNEFFVPIQASLQIDGKPTVFVLGSDNKPHKREIKTGLSSNSFVHVLDGLKNGEKVLLAPPLAPAKKTRSKPGRFAPKKLPPPEDGHNGSKKQPGKRRRLTPAERKKRFENHSPEQRKAIEDAMRRGGLRRGSGAGMGSRGHDRE